MRRAIAIGAGVIVLILLVLGFRGCLDARKERAFEDYTRDVKALVQESDVQSEQLFQLLNEPGDAGEVEIENQFNTFRNESAQLVERVRATDHPDELSQAHRFLIEAFEFRSDGIAGIADRLPAALAPQDRRQSTEEIAQQMQLFLTSDVIATFRTLPLMRAALDKQGLSVAEVPKEASVQFLPDIDWLDPTTVADRISRIRSGGGGSDGPVAPGLHGNGLGTVTLAGVALTPGATVSVPLTGELAFEVQVLNQGENTETDVKVNVTVGSDGDAVELTGTVPEIAAGETQTVTLPLEERPPTGEQVAVSVEVEPVPGEEKTDNNVGDFSVIFTG